MNINIAGPAGIILAAIVVGVWAGWIPQGPFGGKSTTFFGGDGKNNFPPSARTDDGLIVHPSGVQPKTATRCTKIVSGTPITGWCW